MSDSDFRRYDALASYLRNVDEFGEQDVFLLESKSGPAADNRETVVGLFGPLCIRICNETLTVEAPPALRTAIETTLQARSVVDGAGKVLNHDDVWRIPELISADLEFSGATDGLNGFFVTFGYDAVFYAEKMQRRIPAGPDSPPDIEYRLVVSTLRIPSSGHGVSVSSTSGAYWDYRSVIPVTEDEACNSYSAGPPPEFTFRDEMTRGEFVDKANICMDHIRAGDIYQVQLGHKIDIGSPINPVDVYRRLRERNPSPYMALVPVSGGLVIVSSPELFVRKEGDRAVMRPIAGTARKTDVGSLDSARDKLLSDEKECAEHIMLVDLCRNDLGRVARYGSLEVTELSVIEEYSHLYHMVSEVQVDVREPFDVFDVIEATFPAGTMTGAPKVRAMEIIEELEKSRREYYAGAFGLISFTGDCTLGLSIRMAYYKAGNYTIRASAGIVADSDPGSEWRESLAKMGAPFWAITGEELVNYA